MNAYKKLFLKASMAVAGLAAPVVALAEQNPFLQAQTQVNDIGSNAQVGAAPSLESIIGKIINTILGFLGVILLGYLLYAGFLWMTSGGSDEGVKKARSMIKNAIIGLIVIVAAFAISSFVLKALVNVTQ